MSQALRILISLVAGLALGIALANWAPDVGGHVLPYTKLVGGLWVHGLQMVIVPLVVALLVVGIAASAEAARAGRIALTALLSFMAILWINTLLSAFLTPLLLRLFPLRAD
jgi:Na+/H+-dicarboxylate symporter